MANHPNRPKTTVDLDIPHDPVEREAKSVTAGWDRWYAALPDDLRRRLSIHDFKRLGDLFRDAFHIPQTTWPDGPVGEMCQCFMCGRSHRTLGHPPWALSHTEVCRLSRLFNEKANLSAHDDLRINEWLKRLITDAAKGQAP